MRCDMDRNHLRVLRAGWMVALLAGAGAALAQSPTGAAVDGTALLRQVDRRLNPPSYDAYKRLINVEPGGRTRERRRSGVPPIRSVRLS